MLVKIKEIAVDYEIAMVYNLETLENTLVEISKYTKDSYHSRALFPANAFNLPSFYE